MLLYWYVNFTIEKTNPFILPYSEVENCPSSILMFRSKNVATSPSAFSFFSSNSYG